jgi:amino acid transporter
MFVRGGAYRVVREAMGGAVAKVSVSALMFDYILTGPISSVSAGKYIVSLILETLGHFLDIHFDHPDAIKAWGAVAIALAITFYFYRQNVVGIHESSEKALRIVIALAIMGVLILAWSGATLWQEGPKNTIPMAPEFHPAATPGQFPPVDPLGFIKNTNVAESLRNMGPGDWFSLIGILGIFVAFGHSILAMSGLETLAQVYREVESPKLRNFKRAAAIVLLFSLILTGSVSFLAVAIIPDDVRMAKYADNLIGGLAMHMTGPTSVLLLLNAFVVVAGFLALSGAVNTSIIGSNGVLNRVAEDGVVPDWFLRPHPRYGTTYRVLTLITGLQLAVILASQGDVLILGEAYAFGVVWSFVFMTASMLVLRFTDKSPREFKVPFNVRIGGVELPIGLGLIFLVLAISAVVDRKSVV